MNISLSRFSKKTDSTKNPRFKKRIRKKYKEQLLFLEAEEFPINGSDREKFNWSVAQWKKTMDLLLEKDSIKHKREKQIAEIKIQFSEVSNYLKEELQNN